MELNCDELKDVLSFNNLSMIIDLRNFMMSEGPVIAILFVMSSLVQLITGILPFLLHDLPFQRLLYLDDCLFNDLATRVEANNNQPVHIKKYPCSAKSLMLNLCRPEVREFHRRQQIVEANLEFFREFTPGNEFKKS